MKIKLSFRLVVTLISILSAIFLGAVRISDPQFVEVMRLKYFDQFLLWRILESCLESSQYCLKRYF